MDEFLLFKRRLSSKEVETIFRGRETIRDGLVGHYPFDGNAWYVSGNGLHGERKGVGAGSGKYGGALRFDGEHAVLLPENPRMAARTRLWNLIARDFPGKENAMEIAWEREDGIWEKNWLDGAEGVQELGRRYAAACRFHGTPNDRVGMLSDPMKTEEDLQSIREVYLLSRRFEAVYAAVREKIAWMKEEILYLDDKYDPTNERWKNYKAEVAALAHDAEAVADRMGMGLDGGAIVTLEKLKETADRLNAALPVTFPSGPAGPGRFGAFYTRLKYTLAWDRRWRVGPLADVERHLVHQRVLRDLGRRHGRLRRTHVGQAGPVLPRTGDREPSRAGRGALAIRAVRRGVPHSPSGSHDRVGRLGR